MAGAVLGGLCTLMPGVAAQQPTFRADTKLITEVVTVTDSSGAPILGLTARDFVLAEDDVAQAISFVEFQEIGGTAAQPIDRVPAASPAPPSVAPTTLAAGIAVGTPGGITYRDRRLVVLYFDLTALPPSDLLRAYAAAKAYVDTQMAPSDLVALMSFEGGAVKVKHDFTDDRPRLVEMLQRLVFGDDLDGDGIPDAGTDTGTAFGQDDAEFNILNTDRQLSALQTAASMLRGLAERKSLVYFSSGLRLNGVDNQAQLRATTNAALRANVAIYPVDARGLIATAPLGDATMRSPGGLGVFTGQAAERQFAGIQRSQDTLFSLATDTGGRALFDDNDLSRGIRQAADAITSYYIIGYYSTHTALDGKFHRVKVSLREGLSGSLDYRQGYFADKEFSKFTDADRERQLEDALMLDNPVTDITIAMEVNYFQLNRAEYFVPVAVKIPGSELAQARRRGAQRTVLDFIGEVKDDYGITVQNVRDRMDIKLSDQTAAQLASRPVQYDTGFTLLPGRYVVKMLVRDAETGRIGTYQAGFVVPNLNREIERLPTSSVVLSNQRVPIASSLYTVEKRAALNVNPLVVGGEKLLPSVTRVFSRSRPLQAFLQAYQRGTEPQQPLVAYVSLYQADREIVRSDPQAIEQGMDARSRAVPVTLSLSLDQVPPGRYDCQVSVLDPANQKVAFWRAVIVVAP